MDQMNSEYLEQIKSAAKEGAKEGTVEGMKKIKISGGRGNMFSLILSVLLLAVVLFVGYKWWTSMNSLKDQIGRESAAEEHDLVLEDDGFLGYTAADFADAVLGDQSKLCKLEVLKQEVSDVVTLIDTGLGKLKVFTKTQLITYHGTAIYTVDLSKLSKQDFELNEDKQELTIYIPHAELEPINIQSSDIEFGDVNKGMLAFGEINATPEQMAEVQAKAQEMMTIKVKEQNVSENADRFAKLVVWEMYQPIINGVANGYSLAVEFR